ncbi:hypothetical protein CHUAL_009177 [Chamberlinius hualienensis]
MEDLLIKIIKEASGNKYKDLKLNCQQAHDFLESQQGRIRDPPHVLRAKCFEALQLALESKNAKLTSLAIVGLSKLLRDDRFQSRLECEIETEWLPSQLLSTIGQIAKHSEDIQIELMKVLLNMACCTWWSMNDVIILRILSMCEETYISGNSSSIKTACQATASQTVRAFCAHLTEEDKQAKKNPYLISGDENGESSTTTTIISAFDNVLPIFSYFCKELQVKIRSNRVKCGSVYFLLESLLSLISSLPSSAMMSISLQNYLWKEFCPDLLSLLGSPDKSVQLKTSDGVIQTSHRSNQLFINEARHLYSICMELVRIAGSIIALRPMLESVFHRILLYTSPMHRLEALKATKELLKSPQLLVDFVGPLRDEETSRKSCGSDFGLIKLAMDAFVECCHCNDVAVCCGSVHCVVALLSSLEQLCDGIGINESQVELINNLFPTLEIADYHGPMTYQKWEKLKKPEPSEELNENENVVVSEGEANASDEPKNWDSDSSVSTEGPEEDKDDIDDEDATDDGIVDDEDDYSENLNAEVSKRRERLPKALMSPYEDFGCGELYVQQERQNAQHFAQVLAQHLHTFICLRSSIQLDQSLQEFASNYCQEVMSSEKTCNLIINADGVYLATYAVLLLNLKLTRDNFYQSPHVKDPPLNEEEFIETVHGSGVLVYLSATWLAELYQIILSRDLLASAGLDLSIDNCSLVSLLDDLEGSSNLLRGAHLISDYSRLARAMNREQCSPAVEAGKKLARRILTACWADVVQVLSALLTGENDVGIVNRHLSVLRVESVKEERRKVMDAIAACLDGLQRAARLSNVLCLHRRCESVFYLLVSVSCPSTEPSVRSGGKSLQSLLMEAMKGKFQRLHSAHVQSIDVILSRGLELGSYSPECWEHVFRCCVYLNEIERSQFGRGTATSANPNTMSSSRKLPTAEETLTKLDFNDDEMVHSVTPGKTEAVTVSEIVKAHSDSKGLLPASASLQILCLLSQQADRLFDDSAYKLNLKSLLGFLRVLSYTSRQALFPYNGRSSSVESGLCLVQRVSDTMLNISRSGRPLIHIMQCWSIVGLHLIEAACHPDQLISKRAVGGIHDIVNILLTTQPELPHFHFNEALFKPFEKLLCLELCDIDIQDQILMSICEYVESCTTEIKSGWRPLFSALKAVRPNPNANYYTCTALDVIRAFLNTENVLVFCNAVVDCIFCLLGHIKNDETCEIPESKASLCMPCLKYIAVTTSHLIEMQKLPLCPSFSSAARVKFDPQTKIVDMDILGLNFKCFSSSDKSYEAPWKLKPALEKNFKCLEDLEANSGGIIRVLFLLFDGLVSAATQFPCSAHQQKLDTLFELIRKLFSELSCIHFGIYVINHMLLPSIQQWLRRVAKMGAQGWTVDVSSHFKQCFGQTVELVDECLAKMLQENLKIEKGTGGLMFKQLLWLIVECIAQPAENISRLGCSCIRHVLLTACPELSPEYWEIAVESLNSCFYVSLFNLKQLMVAFKDSSDNFYGDIGQVRVAAKSDCLPGENEKLKRLAEQIFLMENQTFNQEQTKFSSHLDPDDNDDDRSYVFLLYPPENEEENSYKEVVSVLLRSLIVGLVAHHMLLQLIGQLLLKRISRTVPALANILIMEVSSTKFPGICEFLNVNQVQLLLDNLETSFFASVEFDSRPGLKFLVQKVSRLQGSAANLYKHTGASWTIRCIFLLELHLHHLNNGISANVDNAWVIRKLKATLDQMVEIYIKLQEKKPVDEDWQKLQNQPIFFLVAQPDNFMQELKKNRCKVNCYEQKDVHSDIDDHRRNGNAKKEDNDDNVINENGDSDARKLIIDANDAQCEDADDKDHPETDENYEKIYEVASQKDIDLVVNEFKIRKQHCSMPSMKHKDNPGKKLENNEETTLPTVVKDQEVKERVYSEMLLSVLNYVNDLPDEQFLQILPISYPLFRSLIKIVNEPNLKQALMDFLDRIANHYGFSY